LVDVGINLQHLPRGDTASAVVSIARRAEQAGLHSIWVSEHIVLPARVETKDPYNEGGRLPFDLDTIYPEAMVLLGYVAGVTTTLRLGTYVVPVIARDPLSLAKQAATLDVLSNGRLELGVGAGYLVEEAMLLGHPTDHPAARLAETIEIMRKAWATAVFEHAGRFWKIPPVAVRPAPVQKTVPVWIGGSSESALRTAIRLGNGVLVPKATPASVARVRDAVPSACRVSAGWHLSGTGADLAQALTLRDAGADLLIAHAGAELDEAIPALAHVERLLADL
jgi:probable F420-dependent oxidoreductase